MAKDKVSDSVTPTGAPRPNLESARPDLVGTSKPNFEVASRPNLKIDPNLRLEKKKLSYDDKCRRIAKQLPKLQKPMPLLPVMIYVIERGCLSARKTIPKSISNTIPDTVRPNPDVRPSSAGRSVLIPKRGVGESDLDEQFRRKFSSIGNQQMKQKVLDRLEHVVSSYQNLPQSTKLLFGPPELITLDPKVAYDSKSFHPYLPSPPGDDSPPPQKAAPNISDLYPSGIGGDYGANSPFAIIGKGFSLTTKNNTIVISQMDIPVTDPDDKSKPKPKEVEVSKFFPNSVPTMERLDATVPGTLAPSEKPYFLRVIVKDGATTTSSNQVKFHIVPNPTVIWSPEIVSADAAVISGGKLFVKAMNVGVAQIKHVGQGVKPDAQTVPVFLEAKLEPTFAGPTVILRQSPAASSPIVVMQNASSKTPGDLRINLPDDMLPGDYKLQLQAGLVSSGVNVSNSIVFDEQKGSSGLQNVTINALKYQIQFTQLTCGDETGELSPTDEIQAAWACTFDATVAGGVSSEYDMDSGDRVDFRSSDNPLFKGEVGRFLTVSCSLLEIDSGDQAALKEVFDLLANVCAAIAGLLALAALGSVASILGAPVAAAALAAVPYFLAAAGIAKAISALIAAVGNDDDPLGIQLQGFDTKALREGTRNGALSGLFTFAEDGVYHVNFNIMRI